MFCCKNLKKFLIKFLSGAVLIFILNCAVLPYALHAAEINENNLLKKKMEEKKKDPEKNKADVEKSIKNMYEWEEQRKKKN